jgi:RsmE family RNA methyltransferase
MGVGEISLFGTDLGEKSYRDTTLFSSGGARAALVEGAAQSRDTILPTLRTFPSLDAWLESIPHTPIIIAADNIDADGSFSDLCIGITKHHTIVIAIGSERGWSERERSLFKSCGIRRLSLGSRALKTETACVAASALAIGWG